MYFFKSKYRQSPGGRVVNYNLVFVSATRKDGYIIIIHIHATKYDLWKYFVCTDIFPEIYNKLYNFV